MIKVQFSVIVDNFPEYVYMIGKFLVSEMVSEVVSEMVINLVICEAFGLVVCSDKRGLVWRASLVVCPANPVVVCLVLQGVPVWLRGLPALLGLTTPLLPACSYTG